MARQTNILSFDEVKQGVRARRPSAAANRSASERQEEYPATRTGARRTFSSGASRTYADPIDRRGATSRPAAPSRQFPSDPSWLARTGTAPARPNARVEAPAFDRRKPSSGRAAVPERRMAESARAQAPSQRAKSGSEVRRAGDGRGDTMSSEVPEHTSRLASMKRAHAKNKAGRAFLRQFGDTDSAASQTASRAAVYKGEMGAKHRHAARMQNKASSQASSKRGRLSGTSIASSPKFIASMAVAVCLVLSCVFLYPSAQQYYQSVRDRDRLAAEYAALVERNSAIEGDVASLQTDSGIEHQAHAQLGWVKEGEQTAKVSGLAASEDEAASVHANVVSGSIEAPETWYSPFLDVLFGVE